MENIITSQKLFDFIKQNYYNNQYPKDDIIAETILKMGSHTLYVDDIMLIDNNGYEIGHLRDFVNELLIKITDGICADFDVGW